jgi:hypothetical protein
MTLKLHFLHSHLDFFPPENMGAVSSEHGESLHRDIFEMEKRCSGKWSPNMLAGNCWIPIRATPIGEYKSKEDELSV